MADLLLNIDIPDMEQGVAFYTAALGLGVGRRFDSGFADPFAHGFCLIEFNAAGYDSIAT